MNSANDAPGTLRQAIFDANANPGEDDIVFAPSLPTIALSQGELVVSDSVRILGSGAADTIISGQDTSRVFSITGGDFSLSAVTVTQGSAADDGGAIRQIGAGASMIERSRIIDSTAQTHGGAISVQQGSLQLTDSELSGNNASNGGALSSSALITLVDSLVTGNSATNDGGGAYVDGGTLTTQRTTLEDNFSAQSGGGAAIRNGIGVFDQSRITLNTSGQSGAGVFVSGFVSVSSSTIDNNSAGGPGGGIGGSNELQIVNSTISQNSSLTIGGGLYLSAGQLTVAYSTLTQNSAGEMAGGLAAKLDTAVTIGVTHAILAANQAGVDGPDLVSPTDPADLTIDYSLVGNNSGSALDDTMPGTNIIGTAAMPVDPMLGALAGNGGLTPTHALLEGSPAIDVGDPSAAAGIDTVPSLDQRSSIFTRVADGGAGATRIDIGAFELQSVAPSFFQVSTTADELDTDISDPTDLSLREAILVAELSAGPDEITFSPELAGATINLTMGELRFADDLTITGLDTDKLTLVADSNSRILNFEGDGALTVAQLNLTGGVADTVGGAVRSLGTLAIEDSHVFGNTSQGFSSLGGGLYAREGLSITRSSISGNSADLGGGAFSRGDVQVYASLISDNLAFGYGAGLLADVGGTIENSTISGNTATGLQSRGGGLFTTGVLNVHYTTIHQNSAGRGGGIAFRDTGEDFDLNLGNSIAAGNSSHESGPDIYQHGTLELTLSYSLIGNAEGTTLDPGDPGNNLIGSDVMPMDPMLGPLEDNGGPTQTHALLAESPAIDSGDPGAAAGNGGVPATDQRGGLFTRVADGSSGSERIDMGAYEQQLLPSSFLIVSTADDELDENLFTPGDLSLREAIALANRNLGPNEITFAPELNGQPLQLQYGELTIVEALTITGNGEAATIVDADAASRIFDIELPLVGLTTGTVTLNSLTLTNGMSIEGGAISAANASLQLNSVTLTGNTAFNNGGALIAKRSATENPPQIYVTLHDTTVSNNSSAEYGGGLHVISGALSIVGSTISDNSAFRGGGFFSGTSLEDDVPTMVSNTIISGNSASSGGGFRATQVDISRSHVDSNTAEQSGGGFAALQNLTLSESTVSNNQTTAGNGGGFDVPSSSYAADSTSIVVSDSTLHGNSANFSGGGFSVSDSSLASTIRLTQSTLSGNSAELVGGGMNVVVGVAVDIAYSTITGNAANRGGGAGETTSYSITHSIIAQNTALIGPDLLNSETQYLPTGVPSPVAYSLIGDTRGTWLDVDNPQSNLLGAGGNQIDAMLGPLGQNGGLTPTHLPLSGSPAIDAGDPSGQPGMGNVSEFDQRGNPFARVIGGRIDIGAVEAGDLAIALVVTTTDDELDVDLLAPDDLSLREAIELANLLPGEDTITIDATLSSSTFMLTLGELSITEAVTVSGLGVDDTTIDAGGNSRLFNIVASAGVVSFDALTLTGGMATANGGALIIGDADLSISNARITGNSSTGSGGGIYATTGSVTISDSSLNQNNAGATGGALAGSTGALTIVRSTLDGNTTASHGGALSSMAGDVTVQQSTISNNRASQMGGGIWNAAGALHVLSSTLSANSAGLDGGGVRAGAAAVAVRYSTVVNNLSGGSGGGISIDNSDAGESLLISHSIVSSNSAAPDTASDFEAPGDPASNLTVAYSLIGDDTGTSLDPTNPGTNLIGTTAEPLDPRLGDLQDNGGPTLTHLPSPGSPVLDAGDPAAVAGANNVPEFDQRGAPFGRIFGRVDIGATELDMADFGDAPGPAPIAYHFAVGPQLGAQRDTESAPVLDPTGPIGDDLDNLDDEDGVLLGELTVGQSDVNATVTVVGGAARLDAWIDFDGDATFSAEEQIASNLEVAEGDNTVTFTVPNSATPGETVARFRVSTVGGLSPEGGSADGEVEDHNVTIVGLQSPEDWGDAPAPFPTASVDNGARHTATGPTLGAIRDQEPDGVPSDMADGDDAADSDDEDGVTVAPVFAGAQSFEIVVNIQNSGTGAFLDAWVDLNADGTWAANEQVANALSVSDGDTTISVVMPSGTIAGPRVARFRVSSEGGLSPTGAAADGEVEDHVIEFINSAWYNVSNPVDVDAMDGSVPTPFDANAIITELTLLQVVDPVTFAFPNDQSPPPFFDVNNNGVLDPLDPLLVINALPSNNAVKAPLSSGASGSEPDSIDASSQPQLIRDETNVIYASAVDALFALADASDDGRIFADDERVVDDRPKLHDPFDIFKGIEP